MVRIRERTGVGQLLKRAFRLVKVVFASAAVVQLVEQQPSKLPVAGSSPVRRSTRSKAIAALAMALSLAVSRGKILEWFAENGWVSPHTNTILRHL